MKRKTGKGCRAINSRTLREEMSVQKDGGSGGVKNEKVKTIIRPMGLSQKF